MVSGKNGRAIGGDNMVAPSSDRAFAGVVESLTTDTLTSHDEGYNDAF